MTGLFGNMMGKRGSIALLSLGLAAGVAGLAPTTANADDGRYGDRYGRDYRYGDERRYDRYRGDHDRYDRRDRDQDNTEIKVDFNFNAGHTSIRRETEYRPRYQERRVRYWIEPTYRTVTERVWIEPVYKTVYEVIDVPARYEVREVVRYERGRKVIIRERTLIESACTRRIARNICVSEGRWNYIERQVCVSEGRWDYRVERVEITGREERTLLDVRL